MIAAGSATRIGSVVSTVNGRGVAPGVDGVGDGVSPGVRQPASSEHGDQQDGRGERAGQAERIGVLQQPAQRRSTSSSASEATWTRRGAAGTGTLFGTATTTAPAALPARAPVSESSNTTQCRASTPSARQARSYGSGCGLPWSPRHRRPRPGTCPCGSRARAASSRTR